MWILGESYDLIVKLVRISLVQYIRYAEWLLAGRTRSRIYAKNCFCQWKVMPFGLSGAPGTFQKLMQIVLGSMTYDQLLVYLDDVIVPSISVSQGIERLGEVFERFRKAKLKLKPKKCTLF